MNENKQKLDSDFRAAQGLAYGTLVTAFFWVAILILAGWLLK